MKDDVADFVAWINKLSPGVRISVDAPANPDGETIIDLSSGTLKTEVSYRRGLGFGIYVKEGTYGQRPDEVYRMPKGAAERVAMIFGPSHGDYVVHLTLAEIRQLRNLTQEQLAERLRIKQPSVQRVETRSNIEVLTLARHLQSMGGRLEMKVVFDDMEARLELPSQSSVPDDC